MVCAPQADVVIAGAGPAGLALAAELGLRGARVVLIERSLGRPWRASYGSWAATWPAGVADAAVAARFERPFVTFAGGARKVLPSSYLRLDTTRLQSSLEQRARDSGVEFLQGTFERADYERNGSLVQLTDRSRRPSRVRCRVVVDCRGRVADAARGRGPRAFQTALGAWFEVDHLPFESGEMCLMDLRSAPGAGNDGVVDSSFLYAAPERPGVLFAQETVLASRRAVPFPALEARLRSRLEGLGVHVGRPLARERCLIPLGAAPPGRRSRTLAFGAAASMVQPASGYSVARALRIAPRLASVLASALSGEPCDPQGLVERGQDAVWPDDARRAWAFHRFGLETLLAQDARGTDAFWRSFFELPADTIASFMDGGLPARAVARAMWMVFLRVPTQGRFQLVAGAARFVARSSTSRGTS